MIDEGSAVKPVSVISSTPSYLRYHQVGLPVGVSERTARTITPLQADGLRWEAMARTYERNQPSVALSTPGGFDWKDAGVGASTVFATALLLGIAILLTRRHQHSGLTSA
jgi:hypothetical protein